MQPTLRVLGLVLAPLVVLVFGARVLLWTSGWHEVDEKLATSPATVERFEQCLNRLHHDLPKPVVLGSAADPQTRFSYDEGDLCSFVAAIDAVDVGGSSAGRYKTLLRADLYFPLIYGIPLLVALLILGRRSLTARWGPVSTWQMVALLPLVGMAADWWETWRLIEIVGPLATNSRVVLDENLVAEASLATTLKMSSLTAAYLLLVGLGVATPEVRARLRFELSSFRQSWVGFLQHWLGFFLTVALAGGLYLHVCFLAMESFEWDGLIDEVGLGQTQRFLAAVTEGLGWQLQYALGLAVVAVICGLFLRYSIGFPLVWSIVSSYGLLILVVSLNGKLLDQTHRPADLDWLIETELAMLAAWCLTRIHIVEPGRVPPSHQHARDIVICLDGTWNHPDQPGGDTNVFRLYEMLEGDRIESSRRNSANRTKRAHRVRRDGVGDQPEQVVRYYRGLGNAIDHAWFDRLIGGAFGVGAERLRDRVYTDIVYNHRPQDRLHIVGFSRGAAVARLVAARVAREGIPKWMLTFRWFGASYKLAQSRATHAANQEIELLGLFDTVAAIGVAGVLGGPRFQSVHLGEDLRIHKCVKRVVHMVSLDEMRDAFSPSLVEPDPGRVEEVWFSGAHCDVGGGYEDDTLSRIPLAFLCERLDHLRFSDKRDALNLDQAHLGRRHQETGMLYEMVPRCPPVGAEIHPTVEKRLMAAAGTIDGEEAYRPASLRTMVLAADEGIARDLWWHRQIGSLSPAEPTPQPTEDPSPTDDPPSA